MSEKRLIDANAVIKFLSETTMESEWLINQYNADWIYSIIETAPTVDAVEVVHGYWIKRQRMKGQVYCSECATIEKVTDGNFKSMFCPNCGAKMDGKGE